MLFNSFEFLFCFMPVAFAGYYFLNYFFSSALTKSWLILASLVFYGWWNPIYLPLLLGSLLFNYFVSLLIMQSPEETHRVRRKALFVFGLLSNLALLGYFKYANFFVDNFNTVFSAGFVLERIILPLGISFFTIQQIAYLVDVAEGLVEEKDFINYSLFVTFFPHLIAGPILHHKQMTPQFAAIVPKSFQPRNFSIGTFLFAVGLFKKVVIADSLSVWVDQAYNLNGAELSVLDAWVAGVGYTFQLYFDFSGYVDMAIGLGLMFNITLPRNFDSPLRATSIINFWERWHITLSKFITTYIYSPIVRSFPGRVTFAKSMVAMLIAMFVSGLWHGAAWTYVLFGVSHGVALVINHTWRRKKIRMPVWAAWLITFMFVNLTLIIFRSPSLGQTILLWKTMFGMQAYTGAWFDLHALTHDNIPLAAVLTEIIGAQWLSQFVAVVSFIGLLGLCLSVKNSGTFYERFQPSWRYLVLQVFLFVVPLFMMNKVSTFVYFQF